MGTMKIAGMQAAGQERDDDVARGADNARKSQDSEGVTAADSAEDDDFDDDDEEDDEAEDEEEEEEARPL
jgi:hypothetical protein